MISYWKFLDFDKTLIDVTAGNTKIQKKDYNEKGLIPIIDQGQEYAAGYTNNEDLSFKGELPVIVFGDHTRIIKYVNEKFCLGADGVRVLKPKNYYEAKFLYYYLNYSEIPNKGYTRHFKFLKEKQFPYLAPSEQRRIVEILDQADEIRKLRKQADKKAEKIIPALFYEIFGDPVTNLKGFNVESLSTLCEKVTDGTHDTPKRLKQGIKFVTGKNIRPFHFDFSDLDYVSESDHLEIIKRCNPEYSDILYTNIGVNIGTAVFNSLEEEFSMKNVALLKPNCHKIKPRYLEAILNYPSFKQKVINDYSRGGAQPFLSLTNINKIEIPLPDYNKQEKFENIITSFQNLFPKFGETGELINKLFNKILNQAFEGSLTASWREAHMKELLQEMEEQKKYLERVN